MNDDDRQWDEIATAWRSTALAPTDMDWLQRRVTAKRRRTRLAQTADAVFAALIIALTGWYSLRTGQYWAGATIVAFVLAVLAVVTWNRRDIWAPGADSVREHLDWCIRRCRRQLRTVVIAWAVFAVQVLAWCAVLAWAPATVRDGPVLQGTVLVAAFGAVLLAWSAWYARATGRELKRLRNLRNAM